jgi:hypothetical protein
MVSGVEPEDDLTVGPAAKLLRRLHPDWVHNGLPESSAFKPDRHSDSIGTSVTLWESDADFENVMRDWGHFGLVVVTMGECRDAGLGIVRVALDDNPNHCELFGPRADNKRRRLAKGARWVKYPDNYGGPQGPLEARED